MQLCCHTHHSKSCSLVENSDRRLHKKNKDKSYVTSLLKHEIDDRISKEKKIESLKNVLEWGDVGKRWVVPTLRTT